MAIIVMGKITNATNYVRNTCRCSVTRNYAGINFNSFDNGVTVGYCGTAPNSNVNAADRRRYVNNPADRISGCVDYCRTCGRSDPTCVSCCTCCCGADGTCFTGSTTSCTTEPSKS